MDKRVSGEVSLCVQYVFRNLVPYEGASYVCMSVSPLPLALKNKSASSAPGEIPVRIWVPIAVKSSLARKKTSDSLTHKKKRKKGKLKDSNPGHVKYISINNKLFFDAIKQLKSRQASIRLSHAHTEACTHACMHAHTHPCMRTRICTHCTYAHMRTRTRMHARTHTRTHARTHVYAHAYTQSNNTRIRRLEEKLYHNLQTQVYFLPCNEWIWFWGNCTRFAIATGMVKQRKANEFQKKPQIQVQLPAHTRMHNQHTLAHTKFIHTHPNKHMAISTQTRTQTLTHTYCPDNGDSVIVRNRTHSFSRKASLARSHAHIQPQTQAHIHTHTLAHTYCLDAGDSVVTHIKKFTRKSQTLIFSKRLLTQHMHTSTHTRTHLLFWYWG